MQQYQRVKAGGADGMSTALELLGKMRVANIESDVITFNAAISACEKPVVLMG